MPTHTGISMGVTAGVSTGAERDSKVSHEKKKNQITLNLHKQPSNGCAEGVSVRHPGLNNSQPRISIGFTRVISHLRQPPGSLFALDKLFCLNSSSALYRGVTGVLRSNLPPVVKDTLHPVPSIQKAGQYEKY